MEQRLNAVEARLGIKSPAEESTASGAVLGSAGSGSQATNPLSERPAEVKPPEPVVKPPEPVVKPSESVVKLPEPVVKQPESVVKPPEPVVKPPEPVVKPSEPVVKLPEPVVKQPAPVLRQPIGGSFELKFGTVGALYVGLLLLLIGIGSLIAMSWTELGPIFKIGAGMFTGLAMVGGGEFVARRRPGMKWWGMGLIGGGYALGYFVLYAMQNVLSVKILDSVLIDSSLLLGWAGVCMAHSLVRKSEEIALLSTLLAFVTISLSPLGFFSVAASAILCLALALVVVRMNWLKVYALGAAGSYATYVMFTQPQIDAVQGGTANGFWLSGAFLGLYWLVFNAVAFLLKPSKECSAKRRYTILGVIALNAIGFVAPSLYSMGTFYPELRWAFLALTGVAYFGMTMLATVRGLREVSTLALLLGLQLVTAAIPLKLDAHAVSVVWLLEVALLVVAGMRSNLLPFRWFAGALAVFTAGRLALFDLTGLVNQHDFQLLGQAIDWRWLLGAVAAVCYAVSAWCYKSARCAQSQSQFEKAYAYRVYLILTAAVVWFVPFMLAPVGLKALFWAVEAMVLVALAARTKDSLADELAALTFLTSAASLVLNYNVVEPLVSCLVIGLFYLASFTYKWAARELDEGQRRNRHHIYVTGSVVLTLIMTALSTVAYDSRHDTFLNVAPLALRWAIEGGLIVMLGFLLKDSAIRRLGTLVFLPTAFALWMSHGQWAWPTVLPIVGILFGLHVRYRFGCPADDKQSDTFLDSLNIGGDENELLKRSYAILFSLLLAASFGVLLEAKWLALVWSCQFSASVGAGFLLRERYMRVLGTAGFVAVGCALLGMTALWSWSALLPIVAILVALSARYRLGCPPDAAAAVQLDRYADELTVERESEVFATAYMAAASVVLGCGFGVLLASKWVALAWACQALLTVACGFALKDKAQRLVGTGGMLLSTVASLLTLSSWSWGSVLPVVGMQLALYLWYVRVQSAKPEDSQGWLNQQLLSMRSDLVPAAETVRQCYAVSASFLLAACFAQLLESQMLALAWSVQGLGLVALGFAVRDRMLRRGGMALLSILTLKLLFIDLAGVERFQRVLSFIAAGIAWLVVSFVNGWLSKKLDDTDGAENAAGKQKAQPEDPGNLFAP
jgi:uncharacterized membrane protein